MAIGDIKKAMDELEEALADSENVILDKYKVVTRTICEYEDYLTSVKQKSVCGFASKDIDILNIRSKMRYITRCVFEIMYDIHCDADELLKDYPDLLQYIYFTYVYICQDSYEKDIKHDQQRAANRKKNKYYVMFYLSNGDETMMKAKSEICRRFLRRDNDWILHMAPEFEIHNIKEDDKDPGKYLVGDDENDFYHCIFKSGHVNPFQYATEYKAAIVLYMVPFREKNDFYDLMKIFDIDKDNIREIRQITHDTSWESQLKDHELYYEVERQPKGRTW
jgi:hypothetical protein